MTSPHPADFAIGDRVVFVRDANPQCALDDPLYEPLIPAGTVAVVVKVGEDHVRVRTEDHSLSAHPVKIWRDGLFPDNATNTLTCLRRL